MEIIDKFDLFQIKIPTHFAQQDQQSSNYVKTDAVVHKKLCG